MLEVKLREAKFSDLTTLAQLEAEHFPQGWTYRVFMQEFGHANAIGYVTLVGEEYSGFIFGWQIEEELHLHNIFVLPAYRRRGIGAQLVSAFFQRGEERGALTCFLEVRASNEPALSFYVYHGFSQVGRRQDYYRHPTEDAFIFSCPLSFENR